MFSTPSVLSRRSPALRSPCAARGYVRDYAYMTISPGLAIMIIILALNFLGDGLRDSLDPKDR